MSFGISQMSSERYLPENDPTTPSREEISWDKEKEDSETSNVAPSTFHFFFCILPPASAEPALDEGTRALNPRNYNPFRM